uniref:Salivary secreted basic tail protein n=1 Tax=Ornithodoros coriaceus TaxID=92741 RepID=B2D272_ORNCO|nr:salivary secreted basic tail protein [Ornithodoros coriaceus]
MRILLAAILVVARWECIYCRFAHEYDPGQTPGCDTVDRDKVANLSSTSCIYYCGQDADGIWRYGYLTENATCEMAASGKTGYCYRGVCFNYPGGRQEAPEKPSVPKEKAPPRSPATTKPPSPRPKTKASKKPQKTKRTKRPGKQPKRERNRGHTGLE